MPRAIPYMCVLVVKNYKEVKPLNAKSRIVVLENFEDRLYQISQRYAPVLEYSSLCLITAKSGGDKHILQKVCFKNAFCNSKLPYDEVTDIRPPIGDPDFQDGEYWLLKKTLYVLRRSPHHWYNIIKVIILNMGLNTSPHDPCLLSGVLTNPSSPAYTSDIQSQLHAGLYVNDFVFYSSDPYQEKIFKTLIPEHIQVDFMENVYYFLVNDYTCLQHADRNISVHLCQSPFT